MAITVADLKFYQSERMTDTDDGGGRMTATEVVSGVENQIFDDLSDVDRAAGDVSIRKVYAAVTSPDTDKYLDAGVAVFAAPADSAVTVALFSTGSFYDERADLKNRLEQTITRGARWNGWLWGQHLIGQRAVVLWQRPENELPPVGGRLELVKLTAGVESDNQFLWITRVTDALRNQYDANGVYSVREVVCEIAEPLEGNYTGVEPSRADPAVSTGALVYGTRYNAEAVPLFGVAPLTEEAGIGDFSCKVDSLYMPVIPTAFSETALPDVTPGGDSPALIGGNAGTIAFSTTTLCVKPDASLYCGTGILPGTLSLAVSGATLTDDNGAVRLAGADVGSVDYGNGVVRWNSACPNYGTANKVVTFRPAARPLQVADTAAQVVTAENRGFVWVLTLAPIPAPGTLRISYRVNNQWYVIQDQGGGLLRGVDSSYGSGSLNFGTGTAQFTAGALPDVGSEIIYAWGTPAVYTARGGDTVEAPVARGQTEHPGVAPGTVAVSWTVGATTYTVDDDPAGDGLLTGTGGVGAIRYATGEWWVRPDVLPAGGTEFTIEYDWGTPSVQTFTAPVRNGSGHLALTLADPNLRPGSVEVEWNVESAPVGGSYVATATSSAGIGGAGAPWLTRTELSGSSSHESGYTLATVKGQITVRDDGAGALVIPNGTDGTINYAAGTLDFLPDVEAAAVMSTYANTAIGSTVMTDDAGSWNLDSGAVSSYSTKTTGFAVAPVTVLYPNSGGVVTVKYRVTGGDTSASEVVTLSQLTLDLTPGYAETLVPGSAAFRIGDDRYVETAGQIYRNPGPDTGAGTLAGSLDPSTGRAFISSWTAQPNAVTLDSLVTTMDWHPLDRVVFRAPVAPLKPGTLQLRWTTMAGAVKSKTVDGTGVLQDGDASIRVDALLGVIEARFGSWKVDADLTVQEKAEPWYDPDARIDFGGTLKIWKPKLVLASSIVYNAVASTMLPPDSTLLGLNAARLPPDGRALIFNTGRLVLVHHTDSFAESSLSPTQVLDCGRVRLYRVAIEDVDRQRLPADFYTIDRALGLITMSPTLDLTGYTGPYTIYHTVADLARLVETDINGTLRLNKALSHVYPEDEAKVSGVLYAGTLQARVANVFAQSTWTSEWSDERIGSEPLAQYNNILYPIATTNEGAYPDRFLVKFTSASAFQVIGENLGLIAVGTISENCAPTNLLTGKTYFTIDSRGWGAGWATGNCLRFNLIGAATPVDLIRAVQPSDPTGDIDAVELIFVGNVDA
jgi:hypothetical protein